MDDIAPYLNMEATRSSKGHGDSWGCDHVNHRDK